MLTTSLAAWGQRWFSSLSNRRSEQKNWVAYKKICSKTAIKTESEWRDPVVMDGMRTGAVLMEGMRSLEKNGSRNFRGLAILTKKMDLTVVIFLFVSQAPLHKKRSFQLGISAVNVTKSTGYCGFGDIYWRILNETRHFFYIALLKPLRSFINKFLVHHN